MAECIWPDCLSDAQRAQLADQVTAAERGETTTPMPDQRQVCGCTEAPTDPVSNASSPPDPGADPSGDASN